MVLELLSPYKYSVNNYVSFDCPNNDMMSHPVEFPIVHQNFPKHDAFENMAGSYGGLYTSCKVRHFDIFCFLFALLWLVVMLSYVRFIPSN